MRAGVAGSPIAHSLSPLLHRAAYAALGLDWEYNAYEVTDAKFVELVSDLRRDDSFAGLSVTMPLKRNALDLADAASSVAQVTGVANTLTKRNGRLAADNTDPAGIAFALSRVGVTSLTGKTVGILGAGATAASAMYAAWELDVLAVEVVARRRSAISDLERLGQSLGLSVTGQQWSPEPRLDHDLVVSVVPAGVADEVATNLHDVHGTLLDVVYAPWPSELTMAWAAADGVVADGLDMLVGQAAKQVSIMTGMAAPVNAMLAAARTSR